MSHRFIAGACLLVALGAARAEDDAGRWLDRMNEALATRNYDGTFFHLRNGKVETLRIIHRVDGGLVSERLVSLDGSGREIVRTQGELTCYLPDQKRVLVEQRDDRGALLGTLPAFDGRLSDYYSVEKLRPARVHGRSTQVIAVNPRDSYRYGYRVWIDENTAMPLKTQVCDDKGNVIEQILFASLTLPVSIPAAAVRAQVKSEGFQWVRPQSAASQPPVLGLMWRAQVPPGFKLTATSSQVMDGSQQPVAHLVYSDGLASVSVFIESKSREHEALKGLARVGSAFTFSTTVRGHQVTAVGEVPAQTVQFIANSMKPAEAAPAMTERVR
ncbi:MAG TPA: MucB/RseB C-terminal domain-containing protein [Steroidobacteraceae bacterium]|nr:MucB/RseB C-terminal domain-containing protein [Steroidobacteraceae bacterium]